MNAKISNEGIKAVQLSCKMKSGLSVMADI